MNALPNPKKEAMCKYSIEEVKAAMRKIPAYANTVKIVSESNAMNVFKFEGPGTGTFTLGLFVDACLHEVSETHTLIQLECRRKLGVIDREAEYGECVDYMIRTFNLIGKILDGTAEDPKK